MYRDKTTDARIPNESAATQARKVVGVADSGMGGVAMANDWAHRGAPFDMIVHSDLQNSPYGEKTPENLKKIVAGLVQSLDEHEDTIANSMSCNTACTVEWPGNLRKPFINLVDTTVGAMAKQNDDTVAYFSTAATKASRAYETRIQDANPNLQLTGIAVPGLAGQIDNGFLNTPEGRQAIADEVHSAIEKVPQDAKSVWLCCTHYPLATDIMSRVAEDNGRGLEFVNPSEFQFAKVTDTILQLDESMELPQNTNATIRYRTSGDVDQLRQLLSHQGIQNPSVGKFELPTIGR